MDKQQRDELAAGLGKALADRNYRVAATVLDTLTGSAENGVIQGSEFWNLGAAIGMAMIALGLADEGSEQKKDAVRAGIIDGFDSMVNNGRTESAQTLAQDLSAIVSGMRTLAEYDGTEH